MKPAKPLWLVEDRGARAVQHTEDESAINELRDIQVFIMIRVTFDVSPY
jgi:hypothetical protein